MEFVVTELGNVEGLDRGNLKFHRLSEKGNSLQSDSLDVALKRERSELPNDPFSAIYGSHVASRVDVARGIHADVAQGSGMGKM